jgi:hypothetical protein
MALPEWLQHNMTVEAQLAEMWRFNTDSANRASYTIEEWLAKLDREMPAKGYEKTPTGWTPKRMTSGDLNS